MKHIETAVVSRSPGGTYGHMYSMHKYWSKKSPDVISAYILTYTKPGDVVLDPFCGSGVVACEAVRLGRRTIGIDINPMATFITRMTLTPVVLHRLQWAFNDIRSMSEEFVSELFLTKCRHCRKDAVVEFVVRDGNAARRIAYRCNCSKGRLFKDPDAKDKRLDRSFEKRNIPYWYPCGAILPLIQKEKFRYLHELFTKRNLIALSAILNAIEKIDDPKIRDVMKLAFTAALDKCSRLKPLSRAKGKSRISLSEGWVAVRFYTPKMWQEVNPWHAFARSFSRVYEGKKQTNAELKTVALGSKYEDLCKRGANAVVLTGPADSILNKALPRNSIDYVLTDPPYGGHIQYLALSTFWGAWLKLDFDYERELVVNRHRGKTVEDYEEGIGRILKSIRRIVKPKKHIHAFYHDVEGPYLHKMLRLMREAKILPERILHQPPPKSFGAGVRGARGGRRKGKIRGHYGSYIVRAQAVNEPIRLGHCGTEEALHKKIIAAAHRALEIGEGTAPIGTLLHTIYERLSGEQILAFAQHSAEKFLKESIKEFAVVNNIQAKLKNKSDLSSPSELTSEIRTAILDGKALYGHQKNRIYQSVLRRFQGDITLENIRNLADEIGPLEEKQYRQERCGKLLLMLGQRLGLNSKLRRDKYIEVFWKRADQVTCTFSVKDTGILIKASRRKGEGNIISEVGSISDENFERALLKWCTNNAGIAQDLKQQLNPMPPAERLALIPEQPKHLRLRVMGNKELCPKHYLITLQIPKAQTREPQPGQFFHIVCDPEGDETIGDNGQKRGYALTLRRPFSVHGINYEKFNRLLLATPPIIPYEIREVIERPVSTIDILYKVVGEGTRTLSRILVGKYLDVIGPIGTGFGIEKASTAVIVAGGVGVAPLVALAERLRYLGSDIFLYFGALRSELLRPILGRADSAVGRGFADGTPEFLAVIENEFKEIGAKQVKVSTDDESLGEKGPVTDLLERDIKSASLPVRDATIYACGPSEMLKAVSALASKNEIPCQVLLEERMACGIGACFSCTCHTWGKNRKRERKRVCVDGPVFNSKEVIWLD